MTNQFTKERTKVHVLAIAAILLSAVFLWGEFHFLPWRFLAMPIGLVTIVTIFTELIPVEFPGSAVSMTFSLPFIAALASQCGVGPAIASEFVAILVSVIVAPYARGKDLTWIAYNIGATAIGGVAGGLAMFFVSRGVIQSIHDPLLTIPFLFARIVTEWALAHFLGSAIIQSSAFGDSITTLAASTTTIVLYVLLALLATELIRQHLLVLVPIVLVPVLALRSTLLVTSRMIENYYETMTALMLMLQRSHPDTHDHVDRVSRIAERVALRLGLSFRRAQQVRTAAVLHDIGKIAINEDILNKPGKLSESEFSHVRRHAEWGGEILVSLTGFHDIAGWIRHHHERLDGRGYPDRLTDYEIPLESKIISVVDAFDAMTGSGSGVSRPYRQSMTEGQALAELERCSGSQFDRAVVVAFRDVIEMGQA